MSSGSPIKKTNSFATSLVMFSVLATGIGQSMTFTLLAPLGREVGFAEVQVGLIISCSSLAFTLTSPVWGRRSDCWGRKRVMLLGMTGYTLGASIFAMAFSFGLEGIISGIHLYLIVISSRVLMASLMSAAPSAASAYIADITSAEQRIAGMGRLGAARTLGAILGPASCGVLATIGLLTPLYIGITIALVSTILLAIILQNPAPSAPNSKARVNLRLFDNRFFPYILIGFLIFLAFSMTSQTIGFYIQDRFNLDGKHTAQVLGNGMMVAAAMSFFAQFYLVGRFKLTPIQLISLGLPLLMISYGLIVLASSIAMLMIFLGVMGLGLGMVSPGFTAGASLAVGPDEQGAVSGFISACPAAGFVLGPITGTSLYQVHHTLPYVCALVLMLPLTIYIWWLRQGKRL